MRAILFFVLLSGTVLTSFAQNEYEIIDTHPRLILSKEADLSLKFLFLENEEAKKIEQSLQSTANKLIEKDEINSSDIEKVIKSGNLNDLYLEVSTLSLAYRLFEDQKYSQKAAEYLVAICSLEGWMTYQPETAAKLTMICGIGYDWLFYALSRGDRELVRNTILQKGVNPILDLMTHHLNSISSERMLTVSSGAVLGSLAIADDFPVVNKKVVYRFLVNNQKTLETLRFASTVETYGKDWNDVATSLAMVLASMEKSLGHDFKITSLDNIRNFSSGYLNYVENDVNASQDQCVLLNPALLWFSKLNDNVKAREFYLENVKKLHLEPSQKTSLNYVCLLWMI